MEELKILPEIVTKNELHKMYEYFPKRLFRSHLNYYISKLGKNIRCRKIPKEILLMFIRDFGMPHSYTFSNAMWEKFAKIKR